MGGACFEVVWIESGCLVSEAVCVRLGFLRRMQWREQMEWWTVKYGKDRIAEVAWSEIWGLQRYCDALVDEVWMAKTEGEGRSHRFFCAG